MKFEKNVSKIDSYARIFLGEVFLLAAYFWFGGALNFVFYFLGTLMLLTGITRYCPLYTLFKIKSPDLKVTKVLNIVFIVLFILTPFGGALASSFFTKKIFIEDYNRMNNYYKQTLFNKGQNKRSESVANYEKLTSEFGVFAAKYSSYHPLVIKYDSNFNSDLVKVAGIINGSKDGVLNGDLPSMHSKFEEVRPVFQDILKRNGISLFGVALVDFHDSMEFLLTAANNKNAGELISLYPDANEKLKTVEEQNNTAEIAAIRSNLEGLLELAKQGKVNELPQKAADLKSSFVKVYLKN